MKKSIFILATLFAATLANAQITLLHTFESWATISVNVYADYYGYDLESPYFYEMIIPDGVVKLYNTEDFSVYKTISTPHVGNDLACLLVSRNILTTDNKVCFSISNDGSNTIYIYNEDGQLVTTVEGTTPSIVMIKGKYYLITHGSVRTEEGYKNYTRVYSLPGNGEAADVDEVSAPRRNTRKYLHNDQVLIDSNDKTYTVQGQEVR